STQLNSTQLNSTDKYRLNKYILNKKAQIKSAVLNCILNLGFFLFKFFSDFIFKNTVGHGLLHLTP
ncbi:MAG: hypothetical protein UH788_00645, partial [Treponemataceae bacterium]|nr:hypothetical protein [Treponemataceae bacterium]